KYLLKQMKRIVLISCTKKKGPCKTQAQYLYTSPLFKYSLEYARILKPDKIFILSAKYGLLRLEEEIEPYDKTLNDMSDDEIKSWALKVLEKLKMECDLETDEIIFLAGEKYWKDIVCLGNIKNYRTPLEGKGIGERLQWLKQQISNYE
ncbi:MAG: DUF6884 domain-containing protein, partial [Ignavibacterium sp.]